MMILKTSSESESAKSNSCVTYLYFRFFKIAAFWPFALIVKSSMSLEVVPAKPFSGKR